MMPVLGSCNRPQSGQWLGLRCGNILGLLRPLSRALRRRFVGRCSVLHGAWICDVAALATTLAAAAEKPFDKPRPVMTPMS